MNVLTNNMHMKHTNTADRACADARIAFDRYYNKPVCNAKWFDEIIKPTAS